MSEKATVWGFAGGADDVAVKYNRSGTIASAHSARQISTELPGEIAITAGHDGPRIGVLTFAELDEAGALRCVGVVDGRLADWPDPLFWSGDWLVQGSGLYRRAFIAEEATLEGLAVVEHPASLTARTRPLDIRAGDYRSSVDRRSWPWSWDYHAPLLKRALEQRSNSGVATHITTPPAKIIPVEGGWLVDGELVARTGRMYGQLRYGPSMPILSVR